jgi:hypothetical protein
VQHRVFGLLLLMLFLLLLVLLLIVTKHGKYLQLAQRLAQGLERQPLQ